MSWIAMKCDEEFKLKVNEYLIRHRLNNKELITGLIEKAFKEEGFEASPSVTIEKLIKEE